jgi:hypothetical protein
MKMDVKLVIEILLEKLSGLLPDQVSEPLMSTYTALLITAV